MEIFILIISILITLYLIRKWYLGETKHTQSSKDVEDIHQKEADFKRIDDWIKLNKAFLDPDIRLEKVAKGLQLTDKQVSSAINTIACQNFNTYINKLRIKEAQWMLISEEYSHYTIDAIAEMAGFSNKVSFYKAFKKVVEISPTDYRRSLKQSN